MDHVLKNWGMRVSETHWGGGWDKNARGRLRIEYIDQIRNDVGKENYRGANLLISLGWQKWRIAEMQWKNW